MMALAAALYQINKNNHKALELAETALGKNPNYVSSRYQKNQLWGKKLRNATKTLLSNNELRPAVERAKANSD